MKLGALSDKQTRGIRESVASINLWDGAVRSGKTIGSIIAWLGFIAEGPPGNLAMIGKTERTLLHNVLHPIEELIGSGEIDVSSGAGEAMIFGRRVYLFGANDERAVTKIKGLTLVGLYGDQIETWPEAFFRMALSRLSTAGAQFHATSNPEGPGHFLKKDFIDKRADPDLDLRYFHFRLDDNPHLTDRYKNQIKAANPGLWGKRYVDGLWVAAEGAIYDMLDADRHVVGARNCSVGSLPKMDSYWVGSDYGTANTFVAVLVGVGLDERLYVLDEYRWDAKLQRRQKTDSEYSQDIFDWLVASRMFITDEAGTIVDRRYERIAIDPSATSFIAQLWRDGVPGTSKADSYTVRDGIRALSSLIASDRLLFAAKMVESRSWDELTEYIWDQSALERGEERPLKRDDHFPDALRYAVMTAFRIWRDWIAWAPKDDLDAGT